MKTRKKTAALLDANAWLGHWPFALRPTQGAAALAARLAASGIDAALVSPLESVLAPDPMPGNRALLRDTRRHGAFIPAPIVNPRLTHWRDDLRSVSTDTRVRAIRLVPAWHGYAADAKVVVELAGELRERRLGLIVTARLEDERQQHPVLRIRGLRVAALETLLRRVAPMPVLCTGLYHREILALGAHANLLADTSMAEWDQTMRVLLEKIPRERLCFGTLTPFLSIPANAAKLTRARIPAADRKAIGARNLARFCGPGRKGRD